MGFIKKILLILVFIFFLPAILIADELDNELPKDTPLQIKEKARQVISLGVENQGIVKMTQTMLQNRFSKQQMLEAYEILIDAKMSNLPEDPMINKMYEGIGKRVQNQNIIMAMEKVQERYKTASDIAQHMSSDRDQSRILTRHIAECMTAGMTDKDMDRIGEMLQTRSEDKYGKGSVELSEQTLKTVKTMARMGVKSEFAVGIVDEAFKKGYESNKMIRLEKAFIIQARRSNPSEVARLFAQNIKAGVSVDDLSRPGFLNSNNGMRNNRPGGNFEDFNGSGQGISRGSGGAGRSGGAGGGGRRR
jgi:hypothetical protein